MASQFGQRFARRTVMAIVVALGSVASVYGQPPPSPNPSRFMWWTGEGATAAAVGGGYVTVLRDTSWSPANRPENTVWLGFQARVGTIQITGEGYIPADSFRVIGISGKATLEVITTGLETFTTGRCDIDVNGFPANCVADPGGLIQLTWNPEATGTRDRCSHQYFALGDGQPSPTSMSSSGGWEALATGSVFGYAFTSASGSVFVGGERYTDGLPD